MKYRLFLLLLLAFAYGAFSQNKVNERNVADSAIKAYTWDIQKQARGTLLLLDVSYKRDYQDSSEDLTLTVAKDMAHKRPAFISIIVPNNVEQASGIFLKFSKRYKDENGKWQIEMERADPLRISFDRCDDKNKICTARIQGGFIVDAETGERHDVFQKFMELDNVYFLLVYPDGSRKSVTVPLASFQEQYKALTDADAPDIHK
jgi:hypothetical protein